MKTLDELSDKCWQLIPIIICEKYAARWKCVLAAICCFMCNEKIAKNERRWKILWQSRAWKICDFGLLHNSLAFLSHFSKKKILPKKALRSSKKKFGHVTTCAANWFVNNEMWITFSWFFSKFSFPFLKLLETAFTILTSSREMKLRRMFEEWLDKRLLISTCEIAHLFSSFYKFGRF